MFLCSFFALLILLWMTAQGIALLPSISELDTPISWSMFNCFDFKLFHWPYTPNWLSMPHLSRTHPPGWMKTQVKLCPVLILKHTASEPPNWPQRGGPTAEYNTSWCQVPTTFGHHLGTIGFPLKLPREALGGKSNFPKKILKKHCPLKCSQYKNGMKTDAHAPPSIGRREYIP